MDLTDLYEKHQKNIEKFNALRDQAWSSMKEQHSNLTSAFGSVENLPTEYVKKFENDISNFNGEWANETGSRFVAMTEQHEQQIKAVTGETHTIDNQSKLQQYQSRPKSQKPTNQKSETPLTEREQRKQEFIRQQKAIMAKARQQQKPKR